MSAKPKVCYLLESAELWGGVKIVLEQAEALRSRGFDASIVIRGARPDWFETDVPVTSVTDFGGRHLPKADCYVGTFWTTAGAAHDTGLGIGAHLVQGYEGHYPGSAAHLAQIEFAYGLKTAKIAISPHLADLVRTRFGQDCVVVRNGINCDVFHPRGRNTRDSSTPLRIAITGPFEVEWKGIAPALRALSELRTEGLSFELVRISQFPMSADEQEILSADEYHEHIDAATLADVLRTCDIAVAPSTEIEGFGLPAMEAMACGCALVLSDIPAFRGFAAALGGWRSHGLFVPVGDVRAIGDAVRRLMEDDEMRNELASSGVELAKRYSWVEVGDELAESMRALIENQRERWLVRDERMVPGESDALTEQTHRQRYEYVAPLASGCRVIDIGCGVGYGTQMLASAGARSVLAIDRSPHALTYAAHHYDHPAIRWHESDFFAHEWNRDSADLIVCLEVFEHVENPARLMSLMVDALDENGRVVISTPNRTYYSPDGEPGYVHHVREYEIDEFQALLGAFFGEVTIVGQGIHNGALTLGPPDAQSDMTFVATCGKPIRRPTPPTGLRLVGAPDWRRREDWQPVVRSWCSAVQADNDATLTLVAPMPEHVHASLVAVLEQDGFDPESIPDIELSRHRGDLKGLASQLRGATLVVPMGPEASRQRRLADCFGVPCVSPEAMEHELRSRQVSRGAG